MSKAAVCLVIVLLAALAFLAYDDYKLRNEVSELKMKYAKLQSEYNVLKIEYQKALNERDYWRNKYDYLKRSYDDLKHKLSLVSKAYNGLLKDLEEIKKYISLRIGEDLSIFDYGDGVRQVVRSLCSGKDYWRNVVILFNFVHRYVRYARDPVTPVIVSEEYLDGYVAGFSFKLHDDFWKTPEETLASGQGDCEDMAVLLYALVDCYGSQFLGTHYAKYVILMKFEDGKGHAAFLIPVAGGLAVIMDPTSGYYTNKYGYVYAKPIYQAFREYQYVHRRIIVEIKAISRHTRTKYMSLSEFINWLQRGG